MNRTLPLTCGREHCQEAHRLVIFYCNDCGEPYVTDNDGSRTPMCDPCRTAGGNPPRAIYHSEGEIA